MRAAGIRGLCTSSVTFLASVAPRALTIFSWAASAFLALLALVLSTFAMRSPTWIRSSESAGSAVLWLITDPSPMPVIVTQPITLSFATSNPSVCPCDRLTFMVFLTVALPPPFDKQAKVLHSVTVMSGKPQSCLLLLGTSQPLCMATMYAQAARKSAKKIGLLLGRSFPKKPEASSLSLQISAALAFALDCFSLGGLSFAALLLVFSLAIGRNCA
mmetsp:Transcript_109144/g.319460  ORF Transcript_109144/g.319460 Transcript_109144/m.319460 type:complete len:216 (+) Transcript_109144:500-1147(+)